MEVLANVALTDTEITQQYHFQPLNGIVKTLVLIIGQEYFNTEHGGELWEHRSNNSHFYYSKRQAKVFMLPFCSVPLLSWLGDIISESATRAQSWDQKAQNEVCLLSAAHTVRHEKAQTPRQRGTQVTPPPEGYFWAAEEKETEENKYVISRRLGMSRVRWTIIESHRKCLILEWAPINSDLSVDRQRY